MTIDVKFSTVTDSIANLTITGVKMRDIDQIPESAQMLCPVMFPRPNEFITDIEFSREAQGGAGTAPMNLSYTLHYVYCHCELGSGVGLLTDVYSGLITNITLIVEKILASDNITGAVDMQIEDISSVGPVPDPAGNMYHGVIISLRVLEFAQ